MKKPYSMTEILVIATIAYFLGFLVSGFGRYEQQNRLTMSTSTTPYITCKVTDESVTVTETSDKGFGTEVYKRY